MSSPQSLLLLQAQGQRPDPTSFSDTTCDENKKFQWRCDDLDPSDTANNDFNPKDALQIPAPLVKIETYLPIPVATISAQNQYHLECQNPENSSSAPGTEASKSSDLQTITLEKEVLLTENNMSHDGNLINNIVDSTTRPLEILNIQNLLPSNSDTCSGTILSLHDGELRDKGDISPSDVATTQKNEESNDKLAAMENIPECSSDLPTATSLPVKYEANVMGPEQEVDQNSDDAESSCSEQSYVPENGEHGEGAGERISSNGNQNKIAKTKKRPRTAREFVARLHEKEDLRQFKRKRVGFQNESRKKVKLGSGIGSLLTSTNMESSDNQLPCMEPFEAKTHAAQIARMKESMPNGFDTRRSKTQASDLLQAKSLFGYKKVEAANGDWRLKGMLSALKNHQLTATSWMVQRELARNRPYGGILADTMGMGKTVMSLACMIGNPPEKDDINEFCRATLVIVPNKSTALQWKSEARKHCSEAFGCDVQIYDTQELEPLEIYRKASVVIATYRILTKQYPSNKTMSELGEKYETDLVSFNRAVYKQAGDLFKIKWYRVMLDEAHAIKNNSSRTATACCVLRSRFNWALSGTPLANSSEELYPYLKYLRCESTTSLKYFKDNYYTEGQPNLRFEALTSHIMYRRTIDDSFLKHRILNIPERVSHDLWISISVEEQLMVDAVDRYYKRKQAELKEGEIGSEDLKEEIKVKDEGLENTEDASQAMDFDVGLGYASQVRKRQAISHVFCIEKLVRQCFAKQDFEELKTAFAKKSDNKTILQQMEEQQHPDDGMSKYMTGLRSLEQRQENVFGKYFTIDELLQRSENEWRWSNTTCLICKDAKPPRDPVWSDNCGHIFCSSCMSQVLMTFCRNKSTSKEPPKCPHEGCGKDLEAGQDVNTIDQLLHLANLEKGYKEPARDYNNVAIMQDAAKNGFFTGIMVIPDIPEPPSTRLTAAMAVIITWLKEAPGDKILVFTQFIASAKMIGRMLEMLGIRFVYYYGALSQSQKNRALDTIKTKPEVNVVVSTLKSGGQSLNLTVANRVIIVDPWWNNTAEQQAFGRVVRIGQEKISHLVRIKTKENIDKRIFDLQTIKAKDVDHTLQDDGYVRDTMSEKELAEDLALKKPKGNAKKSKAQVKSE